MKTPETQVKQLKSEWRLLLKSLKPDIADEYRASEDSDDDTPGMQITIGFTPATEDSDESWSYQTGDNSFTGGAYGHHFWGVVSLYRRSNCRELANQIAEEILDAIAQ